MFQPLSSNGLRIQDNPCDNSVLRNSNTPRHHRARASLIVAMIIMALSSTTALAEVPAWQLGKELRWALGYDALRLAVLNVSEANYTTIADDATTYCSEHREQVEPLLTALHTARVNQLRAYESYEASDGQSAETAIDTAEEALATAMSNIQSACSSLADTLHGVLSQGQQTQIDQCPVGLLLESRCTLINLNQSQKNAIKAAQRARDQVLLHHSRRAEMRLVKDALLAYQTAVASALGEELAATWQTAGQRIADNFHVFNAHDHPAE